MKDHNEFLKEAADANSLPSQTQRALAPESDEDISMYANYTDSDCEGDEK